jgi:LPS sulfotransferase NodH
MTESSVPRHPVFVVGMPRSGTTLLSSLLDAHPALVIAPETHYFTRCWTGEPIRTPADAERMLDRLDQQPGVHDMTLSDEEWTTIRERLRTLEVPTHGDILRALLDTYAARSDAPAWGEKTPDHLQFVPEMAEQFPEAVFVAIVRDPRDVVLSLRDLPWSHKTLPEQAWTWRRYAARTRQYHETLGDRFFHLRYEDLITEPEGTLRDVCAFLDVSFRASMLRPDAKEEQPFDADREPWKQKSGRQIDASNREKWRTQMPETGRVLVDLIAGHWLADYGYARPPIRWRSALVGSLLRRVAGAFLQWGRRKVQNLRSGHTFSDDATPQWLEE